MTRNRDARSIPGVIIYRFTGSLFFANINTFQNDIEEEINENTKVVVIDASGISSIDITAAERLEMLQKNFADKGIEFYITEHIGELNDEMRKLGLGHMIEEGVIRRTIAAALIEADIDNPYEEVAEDEALVKSKILKIKEEILEEFEWAFGEDAEEQMEKHAQEIIENITRFTAEFTSEVDIDLKTKAWRHLGSFDQDNLLEHLERHLNEIAARLGQPVEAVEANIMEHRIKLVEKMKSEDKEVYARYVEKRRRYEELLKKDNPKLHEYIMEHRKKQYEILKKCKPEIAEQAKNWVY